jgi:hypothetical protein
VALPRVRTLGLTHVLWLVPKEATAGRPRSHTIKGRVSPKEKGLNGVEFTWTRTQKDEPQMDR